MSRHHLRHDKTCLNCRTIVEERYCTHCGQENTEPKESLGHLIGHFFADVTHFDSQIFTTLKDLVFRPGFLTREYVAGRRLKYLNPIRMYIFISAMFFLVMFAGKEEKEKGEETSGKSEHATNVYRQRFADSLRETVKEDSDVELGKEREKGSIWMKAGRMAVGDKVKEIAARLDTVNGVKAGDESMFFAFGSGAKIVIDLTENKYNTLREYDSIQPHLPDSARNKGLFGWVLRRNVQLKEKNGGRIRTHIEENLQHTIPKVMFVLLPLFAWFVSWFYSRKKYYYVQHAIFSIHYHSFVFLLFMVVLLVSKLIGSYEDKLGAAMIQVELGLIGVAYLAIFAYLVAALKGMYGQGFWLSLLKGMGIGLLYLVAIMVMVLVLTLMAFLRA